MWHPRRQFEKALTMTGGQTPSQFMQRRRLAFAALCVIAMAGCGGERELYHVSGTVTFDGQPVPAGFVSFSPDIASGSDGTQGYAEIESGRFDTAISGKGITGGAYTIRARGWVPPDGNRPGQMLFREYEQPIQLPAAHSRQEIVVPASARDESGLLPEPT